MVYIHHDTKHTLNEVRRDGMWPMIYIVVIFKMKRFRF
jgi:hypothetical protein